MLLCKYGILIYEDAYICHHTASDARGKPLLYFTQATRAVIDCLRCAAAACSTNDLPSLPPDATWGSGSACSLPGYILLGDTCCAKCSSGHDRSGAFQFQCGTNGWSPTAQDLACSGVAQINRDVACTALLTSLIEMFNCTCLLMRMMFVCGGLSI
jgi:hypothetical protein